METYIATNTLNGKFYIGSTTDFERRKKEHLRSERNYPFINALRKNPEAFEWDVWFDDSNERILEQALLDVWFGKEQCYNMSSKVTGWAPEHIKRGVEHPNYGKPGTNLGRIWWVKDEVEMMSFTCPGEGWVPGRSDEHANKTSATLIGRHSGEKHPMSKLTDKQRQEIKERAISGFGGNVKQLAEEYGVSGRTIRGIINPSVLKRRNTSPNALC